MKKETKIYVPTRREIIKCLDIVNNEAIRLTKEGADSTAIALQPFIPMVIYLKNKKYNEYQQSYILAVIHALIKEASIKYKSK